jgi:hypothetical protein
VGLSTLLLRMPGVVSLYPLKPHGTQSLGRSEKRRRTGSHVSFTLLRDCSSLFILVAIILSSVSRVFIVLSHPVPISLFGVYARRVPNHSFTSQE